MSQPIMKRFSPDGNTTFDIQDARFDAIQGLINNTQGQQGIEVRNDRLVLTNGGYYETGALFEDVEENIVLDNTNTSSYEYDISGTPQEYLDWINNSNSANVWIKGSNGRTEIERELAGRFSVSGTEATFGLSDNNASLTDYGIQSIIVDLTNMTFVIEKDTRNEDDLTLNEIAVYFPGSDPMTWPVDLIDVDSIYDVIVDKLLNDGYIQSQM